VTYQTEWNDDSLRLLQERLAKPVSHPPLTPAQLRWRREVNGKLAVRLVPKALELVGLVRDEGPDAIWEFQRKLRPREREALPVILAAMVPDDRTAEELLAWVTWDGPRELETRLRRERKGESDAA